jgi:HEAT repeat protein
LSDSPWDRDTRTVISLLSQAKYRPAHASFKSLIKDPSGSVQRAAVLGLARLADVVPEVADDLAALVADKEPGPAAFDGLTMTGAIAVPKLVEAMNHEDWLVRNRAVFALARLRPFEAASAGLLAALNHEDSEVRRCALEVVIDRQGRGDFAARGDLTDALARNLTNGNYDARRKAALALLGLKGAAARVRPALEKAATEDAVVRDVAREALHAIDGAPPAGGVRPVER